MHEIITALITPFTKEKAIDFVSLKELLISQLDNEVTSFVVNGTTAEAPTLTLVEKRSILEFVLENVPANTNIIVGVSNNNTAKMVEEITYIEDLPFKTLMICPPYYNKTTQLGLIAHINEALKNSEKDVLLYNIPSRTGMEFTYSTIKELSKNPRIIGIKEASENFTYLVNLINQFPQLKIYNGNDDLIVPTASLGVDGIISAINNSIPVSFREINQAINDNDYTRARQKYLKIAKLVELAYTEVNPIGVKGLAKLNLGFPNYVRLPLVEISNELEIKMKEEL